MNRSKKSAARIRRLLVICSLMVVIIGASTYAWFVGMRTVAVSSFDVEVASTSTLLLSLNGRDWDTTVSISSSTFDSSSYEGNTNKWSGRGLIPMSTVGGMDAGASRIKIFEKASLTTTPGGYRLLASRVDNFSNPTDEEPDGYVVFDLFIKNFSGTQYIEDLNILDEEAIYLKNDSGVTVAESGVADTGIENSVRVAFAQIGRVIGTETDDDLISSISCISGNGVTGICRTAQIWEPNDTKHEENAISWYDTSCLSRTGADLTSEANYSGDCETLEDGTAYPTYAVNGAIASTDNVDVYDGVEYNGYTPNAKVSGVDTFTDTEKLLTGTARPTFMMLAPNSITKVRIYIYIEGQDIDNYDFASIGKAISVNFGFTKDRFDLVESFPEEDQITLASENCFDFSDGTIYEYYYNEENDDQNPSCPRNLIIPETINSEEVTTIDMYAFNEMDVIGVEIPDSITTIDYGAFLNNDIESVEIPDTVTYLGPAAFSGNKFSDSEAFIYERTDNNSDGIAEIDETHLNSYTGAKKTGVVIPDGVTTIGESCFGWIDIAGVTIPETVTTIEDSAFAAGQLTSIDLPDGLTTLGSSAFGSNSLTSVVIPDGITVIDNSVFGNNLLTSVNIPDGVTSIGMAAFEKNQLTSVTIPEGVTDIGIASFANNEISSLTIPSSVINIDYYAFNNNQLPDGDAFIYKRLDANSDGVAEFSTTELVSYGGAKRNGLVIPEGVTILNNYALAFNSITSVIIPEGVTTIRMSAFQSNNLTSVTIPGSVTYLGNYSFNQNNLTSVCIKGKANSSNFSTYGTNIWTNIFSSQPTITWNCAG